LRLQVRFTEGFWAAATGAGAEPAENQWVVLSLQHYYTHELQRTTRLKNPLGKVVGTWLLPFPTACSQPMIEGRLLTWRPEITVNE
jgi:hypothetical protein